MSNQGAHEHFVYRAFDVNDRLLYVGRSNNVEQRFKSHRAHAKWWSEMVRHIVEGPFDLEGVIVTERAAINSERPLWNMDSPMRWRIKGEVRPAETALVDAALRLRYRLDAWTVVTEALKGFPGLRSFDVPVDSERLSFVAETCAHIIDHADELILDARRRLTASGWEPEFDRIGRRATPAQSHVLDRIAEAMV